MAHVFDRNVFDQNVFDVDSRLFVIGTGGPKPSKKSIDERVTDPDWHDNVHDVAVPPDPTWAPAITIGPPELDVPKLVWAKPSDPPPSYAPRLAEMQAATDRAVQASRAVTDAHHKAQRLKVVEIMALLNLVDYIQ